MNEWQGGYYPTIQTCPPGQLCEVIYSVEAQTLAELKGLRSDIHSGAVLLVLMWLVALILLRRTSVGTDQS